MQSIFPSTHAFRMIELNDVNPSNIQMPSSDGWTISLFLVFKGKLRITDTHPACHNPRVLEIPERAAYCTRHNVLPVIEIEEGTNACLIQFEQWILGAKDERMDFENQTGFFRLIEHPSVLDIAQSEMKRIEMVCKIMKEEVQKRRLLAVQTVSSIIYLLMTFVSRNLERLTIDDRPVNILVHKFIQLLEMNYKKQKRVSHYARDLFVTAGYLNAIVKRHTGRPVRYHIHKRVITEALRQARYMDSSLKEVADTLGFSDAAHFSKFFKRETGFNFSRIRRQNMQPIKAA